MRLRCTRLRHVRLAHPAVPTGRAQGSAELLAPEPSRRNRRKASGQAQAGRWRGQSPGRRGWGKPPAPAAPGPPGPYLWPPLVPAAASRRTRAGPGRAGPGGEGRPRPRASATLPVTPPPASRHHQWRQQRAGDVTSPSEKTGPERPGAG